MSSQQMFAAFFKLFEWAYDIRFRPDQKGQIQDEILQGWSNTDDSDKELVTYILELHDLVFGRGKSQHQRLKTQAKGILKDIFSLPETNDRGRVLETIHRAIEELHPGITQVTILPKPAFSSGTPAPIMAQPTPQSMVVPPNVLPSTPMLPPSTSTQPWTGVSNPPAISAMDAQRIDMENKSKLQWELLQYKLRKADMDTADYIIKNM